MLIALGVAYFILFIGVSLQWHFQIKMNDSIIRWMKNQESINKILFDVNGFKVDLASALNDDGFIKVEAVEIKKGNV